MDRGSGGRRSAEGGWRESRRRSAEGGWRESRRRSAEGGRRESRRRSAEGGRRERNGVVVLATLLASVAALATSISGCGASGESPFDGTTSSSGQLGGPDAGGLSSSGGDATLDGELTCASEVITAKIAPANVLFIVDRSASMRCNPPPTTSSQDCESELDTDDPGLPTKWTIVKDALKASIAAMPSKNSAGLTYFSVDDECAVQATPSVPVARIDSQHLGLLEQSLDNVSPGGNTPIVGAVTLGYHHLHTNDFSGRKILVLFTDGEETCAAAQKAEFLSTTVPNSALVGIRTFAIGAPGSEKSRSFLSQIAWAGGTGKSPTCNHKATPPDLGDCHFDLTDESVDLATELNAALAAITKEALTCEYDIPAADGGPVDYGRVNVIYSPANGDSQLIPKDTSSACATADGWQYSADGKRIVLCGPACDTVRADDREGSVSIQLGCATRIR